MNLTITEKEITFIDLFAGIGGFRLGFERAGFKCVFSSEVNPHACAMYYENFKDKPYGDIKSILAEDIPEHDVLLAGFPCQPFSAAGKQLGFADTRGTLFYEIIRIAKVKKPSVIVLENVKQLKNHDKGRTLKVILAALKELQYNIAVKVLNAKDFGVAQNRERIIIVAHTGKEFDFEKVKTRQAVALKDMLEENEKFTYLKPEEYTLIENPKKQDSGLIFVGYRNKNIRQKGVKPNSLHLSRTHKQPNRIYSAEGVNPTLSSQETSGRYFILVDNKVRKLTIEECFALMGFDPGYKKVGPITQLYQRIGNSVCVNMIEEIAVSVYEQFFKVEDSKVDNAQ